MENFLKLLPLLMIVAVAVYFVRRGSSTKADPDSNKSDIGGGPGDGGGTH
ncbi:MAG: hypothetical protein PVI41_09720 [Roseobacter sp.]|jgi:hypothetical protein